MHLMKINLLILIIGTSAIGLAWGRPFKFHHTKCLNRNEIKVNILFSSILISFVLWLTCYFIIIKITDNGIQIQSNVINENSQDDEIICFNFLDHQVFFLKSEFDDYWQKLVGNSREKWNIIMRELFRNKSQPEESNLVENYQTVEDQIDEDEKMEDLINSFLHLESVKGSANKRSNEKIKVISVKRPPYPFRIG